MWPSNIVNYCGYPIMLIFWPSNIVNYCGHPILLLWPFNISNFHIVKQAVPGLAGTNFQPNWWTLSKAVYWSNVSSLTMALIPYVHKTASPTLTKITTYIESSKLLIVTAIFSSTSPDLNLSMNNRICSDTNI